MKVVDAVIGSVVAVNVLAIPVPLDAQWSPWPSWGWGWTDRTDETRSPSHTYARYHYHDHSYHHVRRVHRHASQRYTVPHTTVIKPTPKPLPVKPQPKPTVKAEAPDTWRGMSVDKAREWIKDLAISFCRTFPKDVACTQQQKQQ